MRLDVLFTVRCQINLLTLQASFDNANWCLKRERQGKKNLLNQVSCLPQQLTLSAKDGMFALKGSHPRGSRHCIVHNEIIGRVVVPISENER